MAQAMFGPYQLDGLLGRGGMGEVHRAFDTRKRNRVVALKLLPEHLSADAEFRARFQREAEIAAVLREPHVIPIHDYGEIDGRLYLDMRLVDGVDLAAVLDRGGPLPPDRAVAIVEQVAAALDAAHADGLIHRDVKPSNILVTRGPPEFVYLVDFGIAHDAATTSRGRLTGTGAMIGTLEYMAPERFFGRPITIRVDVYALACVLFECLTRRPPFLGEAPALIHGHLTMPVPSLAEHRAGLVAALDDVIAEGMAKDPDARFVTAGALVAAARAALAPVAAPTLVPAAPDDEPQTAAAALPTRPPHRSTVSSIPATSAPTASATPPDRTPPPGSATPPRDRRWAPWMIAAATTLLVIAAVSALVLVVGGGEADVSTGQNGIPNTAQPPAGAEDSTGVTTRPRDTEEIPSCDRDGLAAILARDPDLAAAWVGAFNTDPTFRWSGGSQLTTADIPRYLTELTPMLLRTDIRVRNHQFPEDGRPKSVQAVLQVGTAVLVDKDGVPRVRCRSGGPLTVLR